MGLGKNKYESFFNTNLKYIVGLIIIFLHDKIIKKGCVKKWQKL